MMEEQQPTAGDIPDTASLLGIKDKGQEAINVADDDGIAFNDGGAANHDGGADGGAAANGGAFNRGAFIDGCN